MKRSLHNRIPHFLFLATVCLVLSGCQNMMRDMAASGMVSFGNQHITPWFMASQDTDVMCAMGEGMAAMTFPLGPKVDPMIPMLTLASGMCADERSKAEELRYLRAMRANDAETAQDARTMQKRWASVAAQRQYFGYQAVVRYFGDPADGCPSFKDRNEQMSYMFGMFGGLQAFMADLSTGGTVGVPMDLMPKARDGLACLDSDEFWGIPEAVLATITVMNASLGEGDPEAQQAGYKQLERAAQIGEEQGVRLVHMIQATLYSSQGDTKKTKDIIRHHVASKERTAPNPDLRLLDEMATRGILLISDRMWTEHTGQRTPFNELGTFWDDSPISEDTLDIDDLLGI